MDTWATWYLARTYSASRMSRATITSSATRGQPTQQRQVLLVHPPRGFGAAEILRAQVPELLAGVAEALQPRIAGIEEISVVVERDGQCGRLTEEPLISIG